MRAYDECLLDVYFPAVQFTTIPQSCNPGSYTDTDLIAGIHTDTVAKGGTLEVEEDYDTWMMKYECDGLSESNG